jgi:hypothetical protein
LPFHADGRAAENGDGKADDIGKRECHACDRRTPHAISSAAQLRGA